MDKYAVIHNPNALIRKHEVWFKGSVKGQDADGYAVEKEVTKKLKAFTTEEKAKGFIQYRQSIAAFAGGR